MTFQQALEWKNNPAGEIPYEGVLFVVPNNKDEYMRFLEAAYRVSFNIEDDFSKHYCQNGDYTVALIQIAGGSVMLHDKFNQKSAPYLRR